MGVLTQAGPEAVLTFRDISGPLSGAKPTRHVRLTGSVPRRKGASFDPRSPTPSTATKSGWGHAIDGSHDGPTVAPQSASHAAWRGHNGARPCLWPREHRWRLVSDIGARWAMLLPHGHGRRHRRKFYQAGQGFGCAGRRYHRHRRRL